MSRKSMVTAVLIAGVTRGVRKLARNERRDKVSLTKSMNSSTCSNVWCLPYATHLLVGRIQGMHSHVGRNLAGLAKLKTLQVPVVVAFLQRPPKEVTVTVTMASRAEQRAKFSNPFNVILLH